ncbi:MAG TPA: J domain-containing protein [Clostridiaceae bacterium]|nr:J domain-containing protein [Clostridiaceae bacterium]
MAASGQNYYETLGVDPTASPDQIRHAYRELVKKYHPDNYRNHPLEHVAKDKMQEVNHAFSVLSDENKRRRYDSERIQHQTAYAYQRQHGGQQQSNYNPFGHSGGNWQQQRPQQGPYYGGRSGGCCGGGCCETLCAICAIDACCEMMGGDFCCCC